MTDVRRERIPMLWSTLAETALAKGFCSKMGDTVSSEEFAEEVAHDHVCVL